ncbi:putative Transcriptional regulatory protein FixJ [delta proteobacterium NaphS2]|nr:putative Transcriptional regulatory protein FixJ [delta proteobacterium NaphS2]
MTDRKPIVYVVDDDPSVRRALERLLRSTGHEARTFASALDFIDYEHPDVPGCLVLDVRMPKLNGLDLQDLLIKKGNSIPVIFITGHGTVPDSVRALKGGAVDFLQKPFEDGDLLEAVSRGIENHRHERRKQKEMKILRARLNTLTPREREVFGFVISGMLNKQIAYDLGISEKTIKVHRAKVMQKMGAGSLADLVRFAEKLGVNPPPA